MWAGRWGAVEGLFLAALLFITTVFKIITRNCAPVRISGGMEVKGLSGNLACCVHRGRRPGRHYRFRVTRTINTVLRRSRRGNLTRFLRRVTFGNAGGFPSGLLVGCFRSINIGFNNGVGTCASLSRAICHLSSIPAHRSILSDTLLIVRS